MTYRTNHYDYIEQVNWGNHLCSRKCMRIATMLVDGEPLCDDCTDEQFEYDLALSINPTLGSGLLRPDVRR